MFLKCVLLVLAALVAASVQDPVVVSVYYESLCPDSERFVNNQLKPTYDALGSTYMTVDFVPYGKATHSQDANGQWVYSCQHGPDECAGNRVQACGLDTIGNNMDKRVDFVWCAMTARKPQDAGPTCAASVSVEYDPIQACIDGEKGDTLLVAYGDRTHNFQPLITFVPTMAFDGVYTVQDQDGALNDLLGTVCGKITGIKPAACNVQRRRNHYH